MARRSHRMAYAPESREFLEDSQRLVSSAGWSEPKLPRNSFRRTASGSLTWTEPDTIEQAVALTAPGHHPSGDAVEALCSSDHPLAPDPAATEPADTVGYFVSPESALKTLLPPPTGMQDEHPANELSRAPDDPDEMLPPEPATPLDYDWGLLEEEDLGEEDGSARRNIVGVENPPLGRPDAGPGFFRKEAQQAWVKSQSQEGAKDSADGKSMLLHFRSQRSFKQTVGLGEISESAGRKSMLLKAITQYDFRRVKQRLIVTTDWRRSREQVEGSRKRYRLAAAMCGFCGTTAACVQHELVLRGWAPLSPTVNIVKFVSTCFSCVLIGLLYRLYHLDVLFERIGLHLRLLVPLNVNIQPQWVIRQRTFWVEAIILFVHLPPFITFEYGTLNWNNFILYRAETIFAVWNSVRFYLFWRCYVDWQLQDLPRKHTVASFTGVRLNSSFTFKHVLNTDQAVAFIACLWTSLVLVLSEYSLLSLPASISVCSPRHSVYLHQDRQVCPYCFLMSY